MRRPGPRPRRNCWSTPWLASPSQPTRWTATRRRPPSRLSRTGSRPRRGGGLTGSPSRPWRSGTSTIPSPRSEPAPLSELAGPSAELAAWCLANLGARPVRVHFQQTHLSVVTGLRLADGRNVVVKARPGMARQHGCLEVQRHLWQAGFPCPQPLAGPAPLGALEAVAEAHVPGGTQLAPGPGYAGAFAAALAGLIRLAPPVSAVPALEPPPPWCYWDHHEDGPWPWPDDMDADLNAQPGPAWLDDAAIRVRARLARCAEQPVVGHCDWESQNIRWRGARLHPCTTGTASSAGRRGRSRDWPRQCSRQPAIPASTPRSPRASSSWQLTNAPAAGPGLTMSARWPGQQEPGSRLSTPRRTRSAPAAADRLPGGLPPSSPAGYAGPGHSRARHPRSARARSPCSGNLALLAGLSLRYRLRPVPSHFVRGAAKP